jgi:hypothetical protein
VGTSCWSEGQNLHCSRRTEIRERLDGRRRLHGQIDQSCRPQPMLGEFYCFLNVLLDELSDLRDRLRRFVESAGGRERDRGVTVGAFCRPRMFSMLATGRQRRSRKDRAGRSPSIQATAGEESAMFPLLVHLLGMFTGGLSDGLMQLGRRLDVSFLNLNSRHIASGLVVMEQRLRMAAAYRERRAQ